MLEYFYFKNVTAEDSILKVSHDYFEFTSGFQLPEFYHRKSCGERPYHSYNDHKIYNLKPVNTDLQ